MNCAACGHSEGYHRETEQNRFGDWPCDICQCKRLTEPKAWRVRTLDERRKVLATFDTRLEAERWARDRARVDVQVELS